MVNIRKQDRAHERMREKPSENSEGGRGEEEEGSVCVQRGIIAAAAVPAVLLPADITNSAMVIAESYKSTARSCVEQNGRFIDITIVDRENTTLRKIAAPEDCAAECIHLRDSMTLFQGGLKKMLKEYDVPHEKLEAFDVTSVAHYVPWPHHAQPGCEKV